MSRFEIQHPSAGPLANHQEWLIKRLGEMNDQALGEKRLRVWERLLILPLTNGEGQCNRLWCYGAYQSLAPAHIPLRPWAEAAAREE
jgi:hypothetical protein